MPKKAKFVPNYMKALVSKEKPVKTEEVKAALPTAEEVKATKKVAKQ